MQRKSKIKKVLNLVNYHDYISAAGLDGLKVLEGHKKVEKVLNKATGIYEETGLYGIKKTCIDEVKRYAKEQGKDITEAMSKVKKPSDLTEETARDYAGYYAWRNYNHANKYTNNQFGELNQHKKDVLLSYFHNMSLEKLAKNKGSDGSMLDAIEMGDPDEAIRRLFMKSDGSYGSYEDAIAKNRRGLMNRYMATAQWYYNPQAEVVSDFSKRDEFYRDIYPTPGKLDTIITGIENIQSINRKNRNIAFDNDYDVFEQQEETEQPVAAPKPPKEKSFWQTLGEIGMATINPMYGMVRAAAENQVAQEYENILKENEGEQ